MKNQFIKNKNNVVKKPKSSANSVALFVIIIVSICSVLGCVFSALNYFKRDEIKTASADEVRTIFDTSSYDFTIMNYMGSGDGMSNWVNNVHSDSSAEFQTNDYMAISMPIAMFFRFQNFRNLGSVNQISVIDIFVYQASGVSPFYIYDSSGNIVTSVTAEGNDQGVNVQYPVTDLNDSGRTTDVIRGGGPYFIASSVNPNFCMPFYVGFSNVGSTFSFDIYKCQQRYIPYYSATYGTMGIYQLIFSSFNVNGGDSSIYLTFYNCAGSSERPLWYQVKNKTYYNFNLASANYSNGYNGGYTDGYNSGYDNGVSVGYDDGYSNGYTAGDIVGYNRGVNSANDFTFFNLISAVIDAPIQAFTGLFNFNFLGVNLVSFFTGLLTLALIIFIIRLILGG